MESLREFWHDPAARAAFRAVLIVAASYVVAKGLHFVILHWGRRITSRTASTLDDRLLESARGPMTAIVVLLGIRAALLSLQPDYLHAVTAQYLHGGLYVAGVVVGVAFVNTVLRIFAEWYAEEMARRTQSQVDDKFIPLLYKISRIFVVLTGVVVVLRHFAFDITTLVVSMGVGSLAIGLAAQDTIANIIAGFLIMIDKPFRIGDRVEFTDGTLGDVVDIGLRSTRIQNLDSNIVIVPNRDLVNQRLVNYGYPNMRLTVRVNVGVAYGSDVEKVKRVLEECAAAVDVLDKSQPAIVAFMKFGESSLDFLVIAWVSSYRDRLAALDALHTLIERRFREEGIAIPFPQRDVHLRQVEKS